LPACWSNAFTNAVEAGRHFNTSAEEVIADCSDDDDDWIFHRNGESGRDLLRRSLARR
jgi:hypothetical protein